MNEAIIDITTGWINVNNLCNNCCKWCYQKKGLKRQLPSQELKPGMATQVVDFFGKIGLISCIFIGGEPTLYPFLLPLIARAKQNVGIKEVTVVTNGRRLKDMLYTQSLMDAGIDVFSITVLSAKKEIHDQISGRKAFDDTHKGILNAVSTGRKCSINLIVNRDNIRDVPQSITRFLDWGVSDVIVSCANPIITDLGIDGSESLNPKEFSNLIVELENYPANVIILHELPLCLIPRNTFLHFLKQQRLGFGCHIGQGKGLVVDVDGDIIPCNAFAGHRIISLFEDEKIKYTTEEFLYLWATDQDLRTFREQINVCRDEACVKCELWQLCNCGCPIVWGHYQPKNYIKGGYANMTLKEIQIMMKGGDYAG